MLGVVVVVGVDQASGSETERWALNAAEFGDSGVLAVAIPADSFDHRTASAGVLFPCPLLLACVDVLSPLSPWPCVHSRGIALSSAPPRLRACDAPCELPLPASSAREPQPRLRLSGEQSRLQFPIVSEGRVVEAAAVALAWDAAAAERSSAVGVAGAQSFGGVVEKGVAEFAAVADVVGAVVGAGLVGVAIAGIATLLVDEFVVVGATIVGQHD